MVWVQNDRALVSQFQESQSLRVEVSLGPEASYEDMVVLQTLL